MSAIALRRPSPPGLLRLPIVPYAGMHLASPWQKYQRLYHLRLGNDYHVTVAEEFGEPFRQVSLRNFPGPVHAQQLRMLQDVRHTNFVAVMETFRAEKTTYVVFENMPLSLCEIARSLLCVDTIALAATLGQVVNGLVYLAEQGLEHGALSCSNILVSWEGVVKIAGHENCRRAPDDEANADVRALGSITTELMGGHVKENGAMNVDDPGSWDSVAIDFLADTTSAGSARELAGHPLLKLPWRTQHLKRLIPVTMYSVHFDLSVHTEH